MTLPESADRGSEERAESFERFERALPTGVRAELFWRDLPVRTRTAECLAGLCSIEAEFSGWSMDSVGRLHALLRDQAGEPWSSEFLREVYTDRVAAGQRPLRSEFPAEVERDVLRATNDPLALGDTLLGTITIEQRIGSGSFGVVYAARDATGGMLAIKAPRNDIPFEGRVRALWELEARITPEQGGIVAPGHKGLHHDADRGAFMVMRLVGGESLAERMTRRPPSRAEALSIVRRVAELLALAHRSGVVHRDLKPENIMLESSGDVFVTDFGLALSHADEHPPEGEVVGTMGFIEPCAILGASDEADGRNDIWSLGRILQQLLGGAGPQPPTCKEDSLVRAIMAAKTRPSDVDSPAVANLLARCTEANPVHRVAAASDLAAAIAAIEAGRDVHWPMRPRLRAWRLGKLFGETTRHALNAHTIESGTETRPVVAAGSWFGAAEAAMSLRRFIEDELAPGELDPLQGDFPDAEVTDLRLRLYRHAKTPAEAAGRRLLQWCRTIGPLLGQFCRAHSTSSEALFALASQAAMRELGPTSLELRASAESTRIPGALLKRVLDEWPDSAGRRIRDRLFRRLDRDVEWNLIFCDDA